MRRTIFWSSALSLLVACGGSESAPEPSAPAAASSGSEAAPSPRSGGMQVEGILGTIPQRKIEETMQAKLPALQRCFFEGMGEVEFLAGHIKFYFHVGLDGRVAWVHPRGSSIGHRGTEQCLLGVAAKTRFPEPKGGGPAEFVWGFEIEGAGGVRAPLEWDEGRVVPAVTDQRGTLEPCAVAGDAHYLVTVYVSPGGQVLAAGAAADSQPAAEKIDCVVGVVRGWKLPDPGSYAAKVSFKL